MAQLGTIPTAGIPTVQRANKNSTLNTVLAAVLPTLIERGIQGGAGLTDKNPDTGFWNSFFGLSPEQQVAQQRAETERVASTQTPLDVQGLRNEQAQRALEMDQTLANLADLTTRRGQDIGAESSLRSDVTARRGQDLSLEGLLAGLQSREGIAAADREQRGSIADRELKMKELLAPKQAGQMDAQIANLLAQAAGTGGYAKQPSSQQKITPELIALASQTMNNPEDSYLRQWAVALPGQQRTKVPTPEAIQAQRLIDSVLGVLNPSTAPTQSVRVKSPDGVVGTIPANQLAEALKSGYTQVK